jgi:beta-aspartyl-peptidase (threonine type)
MTASPRNPIAIAIHGGAGVSSRLDAFPKRAGEIVATLERAVRAGHAILACGGSALDAVEAAVVVLEDSPYFNAGRGAVFNAAGEVELEASIMRGADLAAGAVAGLKRTRNPVRLARAVMEQTPNVMLGFARAEEFAREAGVELVEPAYFHVRERWLAHKAHLRRSTAELRSAQIAGTVGAVALDRAGHVAAATSTGGRTNKWPGRIGDSPIIGGGTYADDRVGAVSATGHGEYFIRAAVAHEIIARARHRRDTVSAAARHVIARELARIGGTGGVIAVDRAGRVAMPFNTGGMYRAAIDARQRLVVATDKPLLVNRRA